MPVVGLRNVSTELKPRCSATARFELRILWMSMSPVPAPQTAVNTRLVFTPQSDSSTSIPPFTSFCALAWVVRPRVVHWIAWRDSYTRTSPEETLSLRNGSSADSPPQAPRVAHVAAVSSRKVIFFMRPNYSTRKPHLYRKFEERV